MMQPLLIDLGWKSALIAAVALVACRALRGRTASERVLALRLGIGALLALPLLAWFTPPLEWAVLPADEIVAAATPLAAESAAAVAEPDMVLAFDPFTMLYCAGAAIILLRLSIGLATLLRWTRAARPATDPHWRAALARAASGTSRPVRLLVSRRVGAPMSWGLAPAWILIAPETEQRGGQAEAVLAHEMAHVRRFDWPMLVMAQIVIALLWFNPLVWWLGRTLASQIEIAADEEAVRRVARLDYAQTLLALGAGSAPHAACGMTYARSTLGRRIAEILEAAPRRAASYWLRSTMLITAMAVAGPLAAFKLVPVPARAAPEPAIARYLPAIVAAARASEARDAPRRLAPRKRSKRLRAAPVEVAKPPAPPTSAISGDAPERAKPSASLVGAFNAEARLVYAKTLAIEEVRGGTARRVNTARPAVSLQDRRTGLHWTEAANGLRAKARSLEATAADPSLPRDVRNGYMRAASHLRRDAHNLDRDARRLIFQP